MDFVARTIVPLKVHQFYLTQALYSSIVRASYIGYCVSCLLFGMSQIGRFGAHLRQKNGEKLVFFGIFL